MFNYWLHTDKVLSCWDQTVYEQQISVKTNYILPSSLIIKVWGRTMQALTFSKFTAACKSEGRPGNTKLPPPLSAKHKTKAVQNNRVSIMHSLVLPLCKYSFQHLPQGTPQIEQKWKNISQSHNVGKLLLLPMFDVQPGLCFKTMSL